jgi:glyoxylase I family protein
MATPELGLRGFSHVCIAVTDMERALAFYRDVLGLRVIFDTELGGAGLEAASGEAGARGRMVGCLVPESGVTIELLWYAHRGAAARRAAPGPGYTNVALAVAEHNL